MSLFTTQGYKFRLVAGSGSYEDKTQLDLFADEQIKVSNNITDLFDIAAVPGTFTRTIYLPGTKKNNEFFEQYYDISVQEPDMFAVSKKVDAYIDFDGMYLVTGYMQLLKVSVYENKFVDSYEVILFGIVSNFSIDTNRLFLTDLDNLNIYNHTSSLSNVTSSWNGDLFNGTIRYALTDSGTGIYYALNKDFLGIDDADAALTVQQFKPAIKVKTVWDAIFDKLGYTYVSNFFDSELFDNMYMILNNNLKYPVYTNVQLDNYCQFKATNVTGSATPIALTNDTYVGFPANSLEYDYNGVASIAGNTLQVTLPKASRLAATINLVFSVSGSTSPAGSGMPAFYLEYVNANTSANINTQVLANINSYLDTLRLSRTQTIQQDFEEALDFTIPALPDNVPVNIRIKYTVQGVNNFTVTLNQSSAKAGCSLKVRALNQGADGEILDVPFNMPYGTNGIKLIDFIRGIQKKFNLVLYEDKTTPNQFKVETFNYWYKNGEYKNFNNYINLNEKVEFIPATSLSVNKLNFTDTQDTDYVSTLWQRTYNRTFGQSILIDTGSYFSQGDFDVKSTFAAGPLQSVPGAVFTGSYTTGFSCITYNITNTDKNNSWIVNYTTCDGTPVSYTLPKNSYIEVCSQTAPIPQSFRWVVITETGNCTPALIADSGSQFPMFIPRYIAANTTDPARVLPRLFFYNGNLQATKYFIEGYFPDSASIVPRQQFVYPYFDNYSVVSGSAVPSTGSLSLLFNNETPRLGTTPTASLIDTYWATYLNLLYNPRTRLVNAAAVIPLADYFAMELNDLVQFRSNYYHLRAINDYNLTTGECAIQLLGPVIPDTVSNIVFKDSLQVDYLVVGGGGGGGAAGGAGGGGGGGGQVAQGVTNLTPFQQYDVTVGSGGVGGSLDWIPYVTDPTGSSGTNGETSSFGAIVAIGGGFGGTLNDPYGDEGNSGSCGGGGTTNRVGGTGSFGGNGGDGQTDFTGGLSLCAFSAGGGGGATMNGESGSTITCGAILSGSQIIYPNPTLIQNGNGGNGAIWTVDDNYYGAGGGAGGSVLYLTASATYGIIRYPGVGGSGGGGYGAYYYPSPSSSAQATPGVANFGGGGAGGALLDGGAGDANYLLYSSGSAGGSGVVIIRYKGTQRGEGGIVTSAGGYTFHRFISGSATFYMSGSS